MSTDSITVAEQIDYFFSHEVRAFTNRLDQIEHQITVSTRPQRDSVLKNLTQLIHTANDACWELEGAIGEDRELLKGVQEQFRVQIAPWFQRSWFMHRALTKPRGYPGDYLILDAIYDGKAKSNGIGGYLDLYFLSTTLGRAVAERIQTAREFLIDEISRRRGSVNVLNVASGPCREFVGGMDVPPDCDVRISCIDYDTEALEYVSEKVLQAEDNLPHIDCVRYNALRMSSAKNNIKEFGKCDIIYSVGLCDYIPNKHLIALLKGFRETLNDEGVLYVALKDTLNYGKVDYQWLVDWFFISRTEEECRDLLLQAGYKADELEMSRDSTGAIMNFSCRAKRPAHVRIDAPIETANDAHGTAQTKEAGADR